MARIDVVMPQMGESIAEGTVSKWLKRVGDRVKRDEALFEISTDKVDAEIPAPVAGVLAEIKVQQGQTVPVQTLVAVIETEVSASAPAPTAAAPPAREAPPPAPVTPSAPPPPPPSRRPDPAISPAQAAPPGPVTPAPPPPPPAPPPAPARTVTRAPEPLPVDAAADRLRQRSTPLVRKIAAEHEVDITGIPGTGIGGRVTKQDILSFLASAQPPVPRSAPAPSGTHEPTVEPWPGDRVEPFSRIRKITAEHMVLSRRISAHVTSFFEVDFTTVAALRAKHRAAYSARGINLTYLAFIAKASAEALGRHPVINAAVSGETIIYRQEINLGIAVALDWGLLVPVIKHANELSLQGMARAINDLGERARTKKLGPDEIQRGTFTITNPGVFGSFAGAPIINQPQVAILDVGAIEKRPKVVTLPDGTDALAIRILGMVSLSYDHRVVDGAAADRFLADVKTTLQTFPEAAL